MSKKEKIYHRCHICDYCELSAPYRKGNYFVLDKRTQQFLCNDCSTSIGSALKEFGWDEHTVGQPLSNTHHMGNFWRTSTIEESHGDIEIEQLLEEYGLDEDLEETLGPSGSLLVEPNKTG